MASATPSQSASYPAGGRTGQALVEAAIAMPLLLGLALGVMQLALIAQARIVVQAAATAAARAAVADPFGRTLKPERAAAIACAPVAGPTLPAGLRLPSWVPSKGPWGLGRLASRLPSALAKTRAKVHLEADEARAEVEHDFELVVPGVNRLFVFLEESWISLPGSRVRALGRESLANRVRSRVYRSPHVLVRATARVPAPWLAARGAAGQDWPARRIRK